MAHDFQVNDTVCRVWDGHQGTITDVRPKFIIVRWDGDEFECTEASNSLELVQSAEEPQLSIPFTEND